MKEWVKHVIVVSFMAAIYVMSCVCFYHVGRSDEYIEMSKTVHEIQAVQNKAVASCHALWLDFIGIPRPKTLTQAPDAGAETKPEPPQRSGETSL